MKQIYQNETLSASLHPLWELTFWTGILLDWCVLNHPNSIHKNHWKKVIASSIQWCTSSISLALLVLLGFFQMYQMLTVEKQLSLSVIVTYFLRVSSIPISLLLHLIFIFRRGKLLAFFKDFQDSEELISQYFFTGILKIAIRHNDSLLNWKKNYVEFRQRQIKIFRRIVYVFGLLTSLFSIIGVFYVVLTSDEEAFFYNYYESLRNLFTTPFLHLITLTTYFSMTIYNTLSDFIPIFVYYHAALHLTSIGEDLLQTSFRNGNDSKANTIFVATLNSTLHSPRFSNIHAAWQRYDRVRHLVERADDLFGLIVLINLGMKLFAICIVIYSILKKNRLTGISAVLTNDHQDRDWENLYLNLLVTNLVIFLSRLIFLVFGFSKLHLASGKLRKGANTLLNQHWCILNEESRQILAVFKADLSEDQLTPCPLGLFRITPSILLTMMGLAVSYIVILLQSP